MPKNKKKENEKKTKVSIRVGRTSNAPAENDLKKYVKSTTGIINLAIVICNVIICALIFPKEIPEVSTKKWTCLLAILGLLFNGVFFILDVLNKNKFTPSSLEEDPPPPTFVPLFLQLTFSCLWVFFLLTNALDLVIRGIIKGNGFFGWVSLLVFLTMFLYGINVRHKQKVIKKELIKWEKGRKKRERKKQWKMLKNGFKEAFHMGNKRKRKAADMEDSTVEVKSNSKKRKTRK